MVAQDLGILNATIEIPSDYTRVEEETIFINEAKGCGMMMDYGWNIDGPIYSLADVESQREAIAAILMQNLFEVSDYQILAAGPDQVGSAGAYQIYLEGTDSEGVSNEVVIMAVEGYVLKDANLMGKFAAALNIPMIIGLLLVPTLVAKLGGMYKINYSGYALATVARILVIVAAYMGSVPMMLVFTAVASLGMCPLQGDLNAVIASASDYTYLTTGKRIDGTMYSCTSLGVKIGGGLGTAISGWLLAAAGFIEGGAAVQPDSVITMLNVMYLWLPAIFCALVTFLLTKLNVEKAKQALLASRKA